MKKKLLKSALALTTMAFVILSGCGQGGTPAPAPQPGTANQPAPATPGAQPAETAAENVNITFWSGWTGPDAEIMQDIIGKFMAENPHISIEFETQQWTPLFTSFLAEAAVGNAPHILAMRPMDAGQFIEMGLLTTDFAETIGINPENYSAAVWESTMTEGHQYAIPLDQHMHAVFYNRDMFEEAGLTPPVTGEEFIYAARRLTIDSSGRNATEVGFDPNNTVQFGLNFPMNHHVGFQMAALIAQQGGIPFTADMREVPFDTQQAINAFNFIRDLVITYHTVPVGDRTPMDSFVAENVAMIIDGPWQMVTLLATDLNWGAFPYPNVFGQHAVWGNSHVFTFPYSNASEAQLEAVREFIRWIDANSSEWAHAGQIPASNVGREFAATLPGRAAFIQSMDTMYILPASPRSAELFGSSAVSPFPLAAQALLLDGDDVASVVDMLRSEMNSLLAMP